MSDSLKSGRIDGFCVGMPWNAVAVDEGHGVIVATKPQLWAASPEKVLGMKAAYAEANADLAAAIVRALIRSCAWLDERANRAAIAATLAEPRYVGISEAIISRALLDDMQRGANFTVPLPADQLIFHKDDATFPWTSHAAWILTQMIRWGQAGTAFDIQDVASSVYRTDLYRGAVARLGVPLPASDFKSEGGKDFFAGDAFDPSQAVAYLERLAVRHASVDLATFSGASTRS